MINVTVVGAGGQLKIEVVTGNDGTDIYPTGRQIIIDTTGKHYLSYPEFAIYVTTQRTVSGAAITYSIVNVLKNN